MGDSDIFSDPRLQKKPGSSATLPTDVMGSSSAELAPEKGDRHETAGLSTVEGLTAASPNAPEASSAGLFSPSGFLKNTSTSSERIEESDAPDSGWAPTTPTPTRTEPTESPRIKKVGETSRPSAVLLIALFTWANLATILALWLWWTRSSANGPLENLPDDGALKSDIISPFEELTARSLVRLGETKQFGQIEVTPLSIESRTMTIEPGGQSTEPVLALKVRVKNRSPDQSFYPTDPAYLYPDPRRRLKDAPIFDRMGYTYSFIHPAGREKDLLAPFDLAHDQGVKIRGQEFPRLGPGESADVLIISGEGALSKVEGTMIWRVKFRKSKRSDGVSLATVVGIPFDRSNVHAHVPAP